MDSILGLTQEIPTGLIEASPPSAVAWDSRRFCAALLSSLLPGCGQLMLHQVRAAALFLAGFAATTAMFWPLRLPSSPSGLSLTVLAFAGMSIWAAWHACRAVDRKLPKLRKPWLLIIVPSAFLTANFSGNLALRAAGFQMFNVPSTAMENTLMVGDHIVVDRRYYGTHRPSEGEVVLFRRGNIWEVKRIIGVEGDTVYGRAGLVYRNGQRLWEPYVVHQGLHGYGPLQQYLNDFGPITVPPGEVFVMGDNRDVSYDSRIPEHGPIVMGVESGKPLYVTWSRDRRRMRGLIR